jgi:pyruvate dehydrogenase E1 component alpha subunit
VVFGIVGAAREPPASASRRPLHPSAGSLKMPRKPIPIPHQIDYLSILDENAEVDSALEPKLSKDELKTIYRYMLLARRADERMVMMQRQGRMGTFPQSSGHEAISIGGALAIKDSDWHVPAYREMAGMLYRGWKLENVFLYWNGFEEGAKVPDGVNDLPMCVPIATQLLHATGIGMAINIRKERQVVLTFFGDGASSEGDCHEAMNFAAVFQAPVVFICLNNQYAISVPLSRQMHNETIAQRAIAYGMPGIKVDGNDALAVYVAAKEAVDLARSGGGPSLIEALTYRWTPHTTADDPKKYRSEEEFKLWNAREPLARFRKYLLKKNVMTEEDYVALDAELDNQIKTAFQNAEALSKTDELTDPLNMFDYLYQDIPPVLQTQRAELASHLERKKNKGKTNKSGSPSSGVFPKK